MNNKIAATHEINLNQPGLDEKAAKRSLGGTFKGLTLPDIGSDIDSKL